MKELALQIELLKNTERTTRSSRISYFYGFTDDETFISNGIAGWFIPTNKLLINIERVFSRASIIRADTVELFRNECEHDCILRSNRLIKDKKTYRIFECNNNIIYVDNTLFKYFEEDKTHFKSNGKSSKDPIQVYEDGILKGIVLPTYIRGDK